MDAGVGSREVADGVLAWLQLPGTWGRSNAGLIEGDGSSLLVDTLFDLHLTQRMLDGWAARLRAAPISAAVNTHGNGDHCFGNQLLDPAVVVHATAATAAGVAETPPSLLAAMMQADLPEPLGGYMSHAFGSFDFTGIEVPPPDELIDGRLDLDVGGRRVELIDLGPAHTASDVVAHVPDAGVVFTGDLCFSEGTPIAWAGPLSGWIDACEAIAALGATTIVPGHGPLRSTDVLDETVAYLRYVEVEATPRLDAGMDPVSVALDIDLGAFAGWNDPERIVANVWCVQRHRDPSTAVGPLEVLDGMARYWSDR